MSELPQSVCVYCFGQLKPDEVYACEKCAEENAPPELKEAADDNRQAEE
ncbi:TPA: hypothetical protein ACPZLH_001547 [Yersinia enterocolitica]